MPFFISIIVFFSVLFSFETVMAKPVMLPVPFTSQAPEGDWVEPWANACEETSLIMVEAFYSNKNFDQNNEKQSILDVLGWKNKDFGSSLDESPQQIVQMIEKYYSWDGDLRTHMEIEDLKKEIDNKRPVIIPFDARQVTNPNFIPPKPDYHAAVIIGYDDETKEFIVHDPGTSQGEQFRYAYDELLKANQAYTIGDTGKKSGGEVIFTSPEVAMNGVVKNLLDKLKLFWLFLLQS